MPTKHKKRYALANQVRIENTDDFSILRNTNEGHPVADPLVKE